MIWQRLRRRLLLGGLLLSAALGLAVDATGALDGVERNLLDVRFSVRGGHEIDGITLVAIDPSSLTRLGHFPLRRTVYADSLDRLRQAGARRVVYDVQFTEPSGDVKADNALIEAAAKLPGTIFATSEVEPDGTDNVFGGSIDVARGVPAHAALPLDGDGGVVRRAEIRVSNLDTIAAAVYRDQRGRELRPDDIGGDDAIIDYAGPAGTVRTVSLADLVAGKADERLLRDRIVIVGATAPSLKDVFATSVGGAPMSGAEVQANAIDTLLRDAPLRRAPDAVGWLVVLLAAGLPGVALRRLSPLWAALTGLGGAALVFGASLIAFDAGVVIIVMAPVVAGISAALSVASIGYLAEAARRAWALELLRRFVPGSVAEELASRQGSSARIAPARVETTVLVFDLRGSTTFTEKHDAATTMTTLDGYLSAVAETVTAHGGTTISYRGDGLLAAFGVPLPDPAHAVGALAAARAVLERVAAENVARERAGKQPFGVGIAVHSGTVTAGTVGPEWRLEYTIIGDAVNTAFRMEGETKRLGSPLVVSSAVVEQLPEVPADLVPAGELQLRGRAAGVPVYVLTTGGEGVN